MGAKAWLVISVVMACLCAPRTAWAQDGGAGEVNDPAPSAGTGDGENPADVATARVLFREGIELSKEKRWDEARERLLGSLALKKTALTYYTLAVAEKNSGRLVAALGHFRDFLAEPMTDKTEGFVQPARDAITELEKRVAGVTITITPSGLRELVVKLDGEELPLEALGRRLRIDPSEHRLEASAAGHRSVSQTLTANEGEDLDLEIALVPGEGHDAGVPEDDFPVLPVALLAGGGVVLGVGIALGVVGLGEAKDAPTRDGPEADAARQKTIAGDVLAVTGGVAAGVGLLLLVLHLLDDGPADPASSSAPHPAIRPWVHGPTAGVELRF